MNGKIKKSFDKVHASPDIKESTKAFVVDKMQRRPTPWKMKVLIPMAVCFLIMLCGVGGYKVYFTPTSVISMDINPSIEMEVNRFEKVISVKGYNDDGEDLAKKLDVKYKSYEEAVDSIINDASVEKCLKDNGYMSIVVVGEDEDKTSAMCRRLEKDTDGKSNVHCDTAKAEEVEKAHSNGLSYGKYKAFLQLQEINKDVTIEDVKGMTMREIRELINGSTNTDDINKGKHKRKHKGES